MLPCPLNKSPMLRSGLIAGLLGCLLMACAPVPVQEMSDARQAIQAAEAAGARERAPEELGRAQSAMAEALQMLQRSMYREAQTAAVEAREQAIMALETARQP
ncbi:MAG: DUF4398 domain-containing protein [Steroidobacteraceae bacterium]